MAHGWLALLLATTQAVDRSKFRTCQDTRFCRVHRKPPVPPPSYKVDAAGVAFVDGVLRFEVSDQVQPPLLVSVAPHADSGVVRTRVVEKEKQRWEAPDVLLSDTFELDTKAALSKTNDGASLKLSSGHTLEIAYDPFSVKLTPPGAKEPSIVLNQRSLLHFERGTTVGAEATQEVEQKCEKDFAWDGSECKKIAGYWEDGLARFEDGTKEVLGAVWFHASAGVSSR